MRDGQRPSSAGPLAPAWDKVRPNLDLIALAALLAGTFFLPKGGPPGIAAIGVVGGSVTALNALGVILILRSNRIINFAQAQLGSVSALFFFEMVHHTQIAVWASTLCSQCFAGVPTDPTFDQTLGAKFHDALVAHGYGGWVVANFWISLVLALVLAPLVSWLVYILIVRRFENAPRLVVTVLTIGLAQILVFLSSFLEQVFPSAPSDTATFYSVLPDVAIRAFKPATLGLGDVLTVAVAAFALAGLALFYVRSSTGLAVRGTAENPRRAQTVGINVARLGSVSWVLAGFLSGLGAIVAVIANGVSGVGSSNYSLDVEALVGVLAAIVIARLRSMTLAVAGAVALGVISQVFEWNFSSPVPFTALLLGIIAGALLLQVSRQSRAEQEAAGSYLAAREMRPIPQELRRLPVVDTYLRGLALVVAVIVLGFPFAVEPKAVSLATSVVFIPAIVGLSLLVLTGWAGQISLGQFAFGAIGGYVAAILGAKVGLFMPLSILAGGLAGMAVAVLVGIPALRLRGLNLAVTTLAFALAVTALLLNPEYLGRYLPANLARPAILGFDLENETVFYYVALAVLVLAYLGILGLRRSRTARVLIAARDNEAAVRSFGVSLFRARLEAFAISGFYAAIAGGLLAYQQHGVEPVAFAPSSSVAIFLTTVIGGLGSPIGPVLGALVNGLVAIFFPSIVGVIYGAAGAVLVLMLLPGGLTGVVFAIRDSMLRRIAIRYRVVVPSLLADLRADGTSQRGPIAPKRAGGGAVAFIPDRYRLRGQWTKFREAPRARG